MNILMTFILTITLGFYASTTLFSQEKAPLGLPPQVEALQKPLSAQMIDHDLPGCPANSHCSRAQGLKRLKWTQLLQRLDKESAQYAIKEIETHRQNEGLPIGVWAHLASLGNEEIISWNSGCPHHNLEIKPIYQGELILKNLDLIDNEQVTTHKLWLENHERKIVPFKIPRGSSPTQIINDKLYFNANELGIYYAMLVSREGKLEVVATRSQPALPHETMCSKQLSELKANLLKDKSIFQDYYCRAIWDATRKTYQVMMLGWSC